MAETELPVGVELDPAYLEDPTLAFLRAYWEMKRNGRAMPCRADIRASDLKEHLGSVILLDVLPGGRDFRYRLIGTLVTQYFLQDATGKTVAEAFAAQGPDVQTAACAVFKKVAREKCVLRAWGSAGWMEGEFEQFDSLYLPLSDDGENVTHIFEGFVFNRPEVMMARQIARANGGKLLKMPKKPAAA